ncbi:hypothetical protein OL233_07425 [Vagococcus sp. PNs007]|uniref:Uncharacterized protein n=1 Tax=Vagococcus proximus TaxID=2991417 RepID=A0ABT5X297_9ENTE|nr:hypothetical protein [Vagococcus proximus]MDF0480122.1 hypothetical protein [Vagococcus proximus]
MPIGLVVKLLKVLFKKKKTKGKQSPLNRWLMEKALVSLLPRSVRKQLKSAEDIKEIVFPHKETKWEKLQKGLFPTKKQHNQAKLQEQLGKISGGRLGNKDAEKMTTSEGMAIMKSIAQAVLTLKKKEG